MNKADRAAVAVIKEKLEELKSQVISLGEELRGLADAEQEKFDNLSEGLQGAEAGQKIEEAAQVLECAAGAAEEGDVNDAIENLEAL